MKFCSIINYVYKLLFTPIGKRIHFVEFHDLDSFPNALRDILTDILSEVWGMQIPIILPKSAATLCIENVIKEMKDYSDSRSRIRILDLCSGGGGPFRKLSNIRDLNITLTDLYPNIEAFSKLRRESDGCIKTILYSVNATNVPQQLIMKHTCRTSFASFHHMRKPLAISILKDSVRNNHPIFIHEFTQRSLWILMWSWMLFAIGCLFSVKLFFRYLLNSEFNKLKWCIIAPWFILIDGFTSELRTYSEEEFMELVTIADPNQNFVWKCQTKFLALSFLPLVTYSGVPRK